MKDAFGVERTEISKVAPNIPRYLKGLKDGRILPQTGKVRSLADKTFGHKRVKIFNNTGEGPPGKKGKTIGLYTQGEDNALGKHPFSHGYHKVGQNGKILSNKENPESLSEYYRMEDKAPLHGSALSLFSRRTKGVINVRNEDRPFQQISRDTGDTKKQRPSSLLVVKERKLRQVPAVQAAAGTAAVGGAGIVYNKKKQSVSKSNTPAWQRSEGKNPKGGLNAKGRASARAQGMNLKAPVKEGDNPRRASFLARMGNMPGPERKPNGEPTRLLLSLQAWGASSKADAKKKAATISVRNKP